MNNPPISEPDMPLQGKIWLGVNKNLEFGQFEISKPVTYELEIVHIVLTSAIIKSFQNTINSLNAFRQ